MKLKALPKPLKNATKLTPAIAAKIRAKVNGLLGR